PYLLVLLGAVGLVMLIACSNVANLLLSRGLRRDRETALRMAIGAGRRDIFLQLLAEGFALAVPSAVLGVAMAWMSMRVLRSIVGDQLLTWLSVEMDGRVLAFGIVLTVTTALTAALAPTLPLLGEGIAESLQQGVRIASSCQAAG